MQTFSFLKIRIELGSNFEGKLFGPLHFFEGLFAFGQGDGFVTVSRCHDDDGGFSHLSQQVAKVAQAVIARVKGAAQRLLVKRGEQVNADLFARLSFQNSQQV